MRPKTSPTPVGAPQPLANARALRIATEDHEVAVGLHQKVQAMFHLTVHDILREAIHAGLPAVADKYLAAMKAVNEQIQ